MIKTVIKKSVGFILFVIFWLILFSFPAFSINKQLGFAVLGGIVVLSVIVALELWLINKWGILDDWQFTKHIGAITVDTWLDKDTNIWDTGINRPDLTRLSLIVEQYEDKKHAKVGHHKWIQLMTTHPDSALKDIDQWSLRQEEDDQ